MITLGQQAAADPDLLYNDLHTTGGQNYGEFSDPEIDAMLVKGRTTFGVGGSQGDLRRHPAEAA